MSATSASTSIETAELRVGMFVHLDLGWMSHPFALSSFRIDDIDQIANIRALGLARVRWSPDKSASTGTTEPAPLQSLPASGEAVVAPVLDPQAGERLERRQALAAQRAAADLCHSQYAEASQGWRQATDLLQQDPQAAGQQLSALSRALLDKMLGAREVSIRAIAETPGNRASHALNVSVLALLMGRQCGMAETDLQDLGVGALSHDVGKFELPHRVRRVDPDFTSAELSLYREHVARGVAQGRRMGLGPGALLVIAQHHEQCDGSGFPQGLDSNRMSVAARVVALVNRYDNLCHPAQASKALTPHEAVSLMFSQGKHKYDPAILTAFVRMMGVYPPGSVVQLTDDRFAAVDSVNSSRPLKPKVRVYDPQVPRDEAVLLDLECVPGLGIRRSLPPAQLPRAAFEHLLPSQRMSWFFEPVVSDADAQGV